MIEDSRVGRAWRHVVGPAGDPFEADAITEGSWLVYHYGLSNLERYCAKRNRIALPADEETLKGWIIWMLEEGLSAKTIATYLSGVAIAHDERGMSINTRALKKTLKAVRAKAPQSRQAAPLMAADLKDIRKHLNIKKPAHCRNAVACYTGLLCGLRQDELTTLDWERPGPPSNGRKGYMREVRGGYEVTLLTSKSSKNKAVTLHIANRDAPNLRKWLNAWLAFGRIEPGTPLLRSVSRWGHVGQTRVRSRVICDLIRRLMKAHFLAGGAKSTDAFVRSQRFSGHSLRAGMVSTTTDRGVDPFKVRARSRHKSMDTVMDYARQAEDRRNSAVRGLKL